MVEKIEGPLGLWPWPLLNTIIAISNNGGSSSEASSEQEIKTFDVVRDNNGRVQGIDIIKGTERDE